MNKKLPQHIAIVMDGNGRWAQQRGLMRVEGHREGVKAVKTVIQCCLEHQIEVLSLFAFSSENWLRPATEVEFLMELFLQSLNKEVSELHKNGIQLRFTGDRTLLSPALCGQMQQSEQLTRENTKLCLNIVINYGGKWDIVQAAKAIALQIKSNQITLDDINETTLAQHMCMADLPEPDLFIRTSGEQRISNFFLWQMAYTELYFTDIHWPDFNAEEFNKALGNFEQRQRRYGKTSQQVLEISHV